MNFLLWTLSLLTSALLRLNVSAPRNGTSNLPLVDIFRWPKGSNPLFDTNLIVVFFIALAALLLAIKAYGRYTTEDQESEPLIIFHDITTHFGLHIKAQWLLIQIAKQQNLSTPLALIICHTTFQYYVDRYMQAQPQAKQLALTNEIKHIQTTLFGQLQSPTNTTH